MTNENSRKIKKSRKRAKVDIVLNRRIELAKTIEDFQKKGLPITRQVLIDALKKKGFIVDRYILYNDRIDLNKGNTFIRDLTESNFSAFMQGIWDKLEWMEHEAIIQYEKKWTNNKTVTKKLDGKKTDKITETHKTNEIATPKIAFLGLMKDIQKAKYDFLTNHNIHFSAALLQQKFQQMQQQLYTLQKENEETKK